MDLSPRAMALRLVLWCAVFGWAVYKIRTSGDVAAGSQMALAPDLRVLERPADVAARSVAGPILDPEGLSRGLEAARQAGAACGARGVELDVEVGPEGLTRATLVGQVADDAAACLTRAVWAQAWPAGPGQMESSVRF